LRNRLKPWVVVLCTALLFALATGAGAEDLSASSRVFYLALKRGECGMKTGSPKTVAVVPCSNARHTFEVYSVRHGGWGHGTEPSISVLTSEMRQICLTAYTQITGRSLATPYGYQWFAPDPGKEEAQYGDKLICSLVHWPQTGVPLGSGWHVRR
jgi:hypothetical protein